MEVESDYRASLLEEVLPRSEVVARPALERCLGERDEHCGRAVETEALTVPSR